MIPQLFHRAYETLLNNQNQFASGGMLLMVIGAIGASLRKIPYDAWEWIVRQTTLSMSIVDETEAFTWFKYWYQTQEHCKKSRRVDVFSKTRDGITEPSFSPAVGNHWFFYKRRPLFISFNRSDEKKQDVYAARRTESFTLHTWGRNQQYLRNLIAEMRQVYLKGRHGRSQLFIWKGSNGYWDDIGGFEPRSLESVVLPPEQKNRVVEDIEKFRQSQEWYRTTGVPYHRGYLFYGPPGTGKTSFITGLANRFSSDIYILKLSEHSDASLSEAVSRCHANGFVVMEDVDCVVAARRELNEKEMQKAKKREKDALSFVSLSGLLNVLDGLQAPHGVMFFMTTNKVEVLDEALQRPGRIDIKELIGPATLGQKTELYQKFFPEISEDAAVRFAASHPNVTTMADFQGLLMKGRNTTPVAKVRSSDGFELLEIEREA